MATRSLSSDVNKARFQRFIDEPETPIDLLGDHDWFVPLAWRGLHKAVIEMTVQTDGTVTGGPARLMLRGAIDSGATPTRYFEAGCYQAINTGAAVGSGGLTHSWLMATASPTVVATTGALIQAWFISSGSMLAEPAVNESRFNQLWLRWARNAITMSAGTYLRATKVGLQLYFSEA